RAVGEAPGKHAFVTHYAGSSDVMKNMLDYPSRFGDADTFKTTTNASMYLSLLKDRGFSFTGPLASILRRYIAKPSAIFANDATYYYNFDLFYSRFPSAFMGVDLSYDPVALTDEIFKTVVEPTRGAGKLFSTFPYLTWLYTTLSPEDMTSDPVFSFN